MRSTSAPMLPPIMGVEQRPTFDLVIIRIFDAPPELVFKMWTDPRHFLRWLGPRGFAALSAEMDVRPGGRHSASLRAPDGRIIHLDGTYREIVEPERLVFTLAWHGNQGAVETLVTVTFAGGNGKTFMIFCQTAFESVAARDGSYRAWSQEFDKLDGYIGSIGPPLRGSRRASN